MATIDQLSAALVKADAAGDVDAARAFANEIRKLKQPEQKPIDVTADMSGFEKFAAGAGKAVTDIGRGIGQRMGMVSQADIDESRRLDKQLMNTGAGMAGNIAGNVAATLPTAFIPGVNTVVGGAAVGAGLGALQPTGEGESVLQNVAMGGAAGGSLPAIMNMGRAAKAALYDPLAGHEKIVGSALARMSGNDPKAVVSALRAKGAATPGVKLSAGTVSRNEGLAALEDAIKAQMPSGELARTGQVNRNSLADALRGIAGTPEDMATAVAQREGAANSLYGKAFQSDAMRQNLANDAKSQASGLYSSGGSPSISSELSSPEIKQLMERPTFKDAYSFAKKMMADQGMPVKGETLIRTSGSKATGVIDTLPVQGMDAAGMPTTSFIEKARTIPGSKPYSITSGESGPTTLQELHYVKLALDKMKNPNAMTSAERVQNASINDISSALDKELQNVSSLYGNARKTHQQLSQPINQMQVGQSLANKLIPATADDMPAALNYATLARAMRDPDAVARTATGFQGAKMGSIFSPEQMGTVQGVTSDSSRIAEALRRGMGSGSPTSRRLTQGDMLSQHFAEQAPITSRVLSVVGQIPGMNIATKGASALGSMVGDKAQQKMLSQMDEMLANDPIGVAKMIEKELSRIAPTERQKIIQALPQSVVLGLSSNAMQ